MKVTTHTHTEMHLTVDGKMMTVHNINGGADFADTNRGNIAEAIIKNLSGLSEIKPAGKGTLDLEGTEVKGNAAQFRSHSTEQLPTEKTAFIKAVADSFEGWLVENECHTILLVLVRDNEVVIIEMTPAEMTKMLTAGKVRVSVDMKARKIRLADFTNDWAFWELMDWCRA